MPLPLQPPPQHTLREDAGTERVGGGRVDWQVTTVTRIMSWIKVAHDMKRICFYLEALQRKGILRQ